MVPFQLSICSSLRYTSLGTDDRVDSAGNRFDESLFHRIVSSGNSAGLVARLRHRITVKTQSKNIDIMEMMERIGRSSVAVLNRLDFDLVKGSRIFMVFKNRFSN
ncbi:unnamed protein product [Acanthocheilonema viteae]|uniref:Uncharacterized protein n=1 Tax=Acanthocheilonema viteae TaxID=6277 RepID=A0A498SFI2_ACAVI|nr:unnamed protein product [Acanthocheilonema viteae]